MKQRENSCMSIIISAIVIAIVGQMLKSSESFINFVHSLSIESDYGVSILIIITTFIVGGPITWFVIGILCKFFLGIQKKRKDS